MIILKCFPHIFLQKKKKKRKKKKKKKKKKRECPLLSSFLPHHHTFHSSLPPFYPFTHFIFLPIHLRHNPLHRLIASHHHLLSYTLATNHFSERIAILIEVYPCAAHYLLFISCPSLCTFLCYFLHDTLPRERRKGEL